MKWRIEGTVDNTADPDAEPIVISETVEAADVEDALNKLDPTLHELAAKRGWSKGDYDIETEQEIVSDVCPKCGKDAPKLMLNDNGPVFRCEEDGEVFGPGFTDDDEEEEERNGEDANQR
jgi:hypothetical protein